MTIFELMNAMVPDQPFAVVKVTEDGKEEPLYVGDGADDEVETVLNMEV